jgi:MYXO-CTERM domain-containing protein
VSGNQIFVEEVNCGRARDLYIPRVRWLVRALGAIVLLGLVLTARHCVSDVDTGSNCDIDGNAIRGGQIYGNRAPTDLGILTGATLRDEVDAYGKELFTLPDDTLCNRDIAYLLLDKALTQVPIAQLRLESPPVEGELIRAVGWGFNNNGILVARYRRDDIPILKVGPTEDGGLGPDGAAEFEVGESICQGDSGGPAYSETTRAVLGIVSRGGNGKLLDPLTARPGTFCIDDGEYITYNLYTRVDHFADLTAAAFAAAGTDPWVEGGPDPRKAKVGEPCAANADCRSDICLGLPDKGYCSQACDGTEGSCPDALRCVYVEEQPRCKLPDEGCAAAPGGAGGSGALGLVVVGLARVIRRARRRAT